MKSLKKTSAKAIMDYRPAKRLMKMIKYEMYLLLRLVLMILKISMK